MEGFDVGVVLWCADVRELLKDSFVFQINPNGLGNELRTVIIADGHGLGFLFQQY